MTSAASVPADPYQPPKGIEPKPSVASPGSEGIRYLYVYGYVFENPNWSTNLLFAFVCMFIPVIGPLLLMGYQFDIVEHQHRFPGRIYPDFNFNRFSYYLVRGVWPFLASLIFSIPATLIIYAILGPCWLLLVLAAKSAGHDAEGMIVGLGMIPLLMLEFFLIVLVQIIVQPFVLRAGMSQDFGQTFKFRWVMDFIKKVWLQLLLFQLFFMVTAIPLVLAGFLVFCIGMYFAAALIFLAQGGMYLQLYNLYLARGGEPIPLKKPDAATAPA